MYINNLLKSAKYKDHSALATFLSAECDMTEELKELNLEDAVPSTLSRQAALEAHGKAAANSFIAAAYYPDWAASTVPPESLDYSKFDVLYFGAHYAQYVQPIMS